MEIEQQIRNQIKDHPILLFMKGSPVTPRCGFSARAVEILNTIGCKYAYVDILENPDIRATLPKIANWPTFPQLWVDKELVGGSDILMEMFHNNELQELIAKLDEQ